MLQVARLAPSILGEEATELIREFIMSQQAENGGFADRGEEADLYYTSFAIDALTAIQAGLPEDSLRGFLDQHLKNLDDLDFVHLCCLARCFSSLSEKPDTKMLAPVFERIETYRCPDGGYNQADDNETGSAYASFLAYGAYSDHQLELPNTEGVAHSLSQLLTPTGAWANDVELPVPNIPATAAAITLSRNLRLPIPDETVPWILSCLHPTGGFVPFPMAPLPDLLTTAVALHALDGLQIDFENRKEGLLDFVDSLWTADGGFHGSWEDDDLDIEYTYYGLLALGHLAL